LFRTFSNIKQIASITPETIVAANALFRQYDSLFKNTVTMHEKKKTTLSNVHIGLEMFVVKDTLSVLDGSV